MYKRIAIGLIVLIFVLGVAFVFYQQHTAIQQLEDQLAQDKEKLEGNDTPSVHPGASTSDTKPPDEPGFVWVRHGDHWDKVPIAQTPQGPIAQPVRPPVPTYTGTLTYHEELLKTNPVKALRLQAEERGHPCAKWIPPFPLDDLEAQTFARNAYLSVYLDEADPKYEKAESAYLGKLRALSRAIFEEGQGSGRSYDLLKITWVIGSIPQSHYRGNVALFPSDYFPPIRDLR